MININVGGTLKALTAVSTQPIAGTIKSFSAVYTNVGGTLKKLFPDEKPAYMFQISDTNGGGVAGHTSSTTVLSDWQTAEIGYKYQYSNTVSATGSSGIANIRFNSQTATFHVKENCRLKIIGLNNAIMKINGAEKAEGTYAVSPTDEIYFSFSIAATSSGAEVSTFGAISFELIS